MNGLLFEPTSVLRFSNHEGSTRAETLEHPIEYRKVQKKLFSLFLKLYGDESVVEKLHSSLIRYLVEYNLARLSQYRRYCQSDQDADSYTDDNETYDHRLADDETTESNMSADDVSSVLDDYSDGEIATSRDGYHHGRRAVSTSRKDPTDPQFHVEKPTSLKANESSPEAISVSVFSPATNSILTTLRDAETQTPPVDDRVRGKVQIVYDSDYEPAGMNGDIMTATSTVTHSGHSRTSDSSSVSHMRRLEPSMAISSSSESRKSYSSIASDSVVDSA